VKAWSEHFVYPCRDCHCRWWPSWEGGVHPDCGSRRQAAENR